ncbi:unnamed protein product [Blepharisma stoltei]|uniref:Protein kinase domain-containing protein n=1 Tax=Blepharisma stoltei TaxID=1481888 RepID=A0AAU9IZX7_9CILI|nr:unnamed protein product [Blepharisma stoltei]
MNINEIIESNEAIKAQFIIIDSDSITANHTFYYSLVWEDISIDIIEEVLKSISGLYENGIEFYNLPVYTIILNKTPSLRILYDRRYIDKVAKPRDENSLSLSDYVQNMWESVNEIFFNTWFDHSSFLEVIPKEELNNPDFMSGDPIAIGGDSLIYKNILFGQEVAIKVPKNTPNLETLWKELKMAMLSHHKNVLDILGVVISDNKIGIISEYCERGTLKQYLLEHSIEITEKDKLNLLIGASYGLMWIHLRGICHLDIKPQNILIDKFNTPKICDFNISEFQSSKTTTKGKCTLIYASPEQLQAKIIDKSSDIWSFGMTMFEIFLNEKPFERNIQITNQQGLEYFNERHQEFMSNLAFKRWKPLIIAEFERKFPFICSIIRETWSFDKSLRPSSKKINSELRECELIMGSSENINS